MALTKTKWKVAFTVYTINDVNWCLGLGGAESYVAAVFTF